MIERLFAKYARAVSDERERQYLYKKFKSKTIVSIIFYVLCVLVIAFALILGDKLDDGAALAVLTIVILSWTGFAVAALCLWLSFRKTYDKILERPADENEMPEVTAYRRKVLQDRKTTLKKLWWAWAVFFVCVALFIVFIVIDTVKNPDGEEFGVWGGVATATLLAGAITLFIAYIIYSAMKQQRGKSVEQQTAGEASAIDRAQGRKTEYKLEADSNIASYKYLFPNPELFKEAEKEKKRYGKLFVGGMIAFVLIAVAVMTVLFCSEDFGKDFSGYAFPAAMTVYFAGIFLLLLPSTIKLNALEKRQKAELETNPEYADNFEWYNLYKDFSKFKGKICLIFYALSVALGWALAVLFPNEAWSLLSAGLVIAGILVHNKLLKNLRLKAIPIEKRIDEKELALRDMKFRISLGEANENTYLFYDGDSLVSSGESGDTVLYLENTDECLDVDSETGKIKSISSGKMNLYEIPNKEIPSPENATCGVLYAENTLTKGVTRRINFCGGEWYDGESKNYLVGSIKDGEKWYRIYKNVYIQLSDDGELLCVLCTGIEYPKGN